VPFQAIDSSPSFDRRSLHFFDASAETVPRLMNQNIGDPLMDCELCKDDMALFGDDNAFVRYDNNSLSKGHILVVPRRHVADFFEMTWAEKTSILALLGARADIALQHSPAGYNIGVNIGKAAGQSRMHVHVHLIPRYVGDVADPSGGIRCVLPRPPKRQ
jgi:diadenosine tetraphosphate (Ap4A) HIT family hydrolase